ncbi:TPA: hypothetical protein L4844_005418 [Pseudomonas aeruginosa]|nr:hypothetical protein [Pseudomonas aeruginosa]
MQKNENFAKQAEQAEAERPEVVAWQYRVTAGPQTGWSLWHPGKGEEFERSYTVERRPLMTVAQHDRIVGELRAERDGAIKLLGQSVWQKIERLTQERDAALARVAELEKQEPVAYVLFRDGEVYYETDDNIVISNTPGDETDLYRWLPVFTAPAAQAQQLHDLDKQCRDDVARALGLRPSQERGFAWSYLLASIKSCVKASEDAAQAQHSVPEGWVQSLPLKDHQPCKPNEDRANGYTIPIYSRPVLVEEALRKLRAVLCDPIGNVVIDGSDGDREEVQRALGMLAAAPGNSAQHSVPELLEWAVGRWHAEVSLRPLINVHRRALDDTWRQVIRRLGGDTGLLCGPSHDELLAAAPGTEVPQAWLDVQAERRRQITAEGWTPEHDDLYCAAELPRAAAAYILNGANDEAPAIWPFSAKWWKPRDARSNYVRAGALILAEIERLDRAAAAGKEVGHE